MSALRETKQLPLSLQEEPQMSKWLISISGINDWVLYWPPYQ